MPALVMARELPKLDPAVSPSADHYYANLTFRAESSDGATISVNISTIRMSDDERAAVEDALGVFVQALVDGGATLAGSFPEVQTEQRQAELKAEAGVELQAEPPVGQPVR